MRQRVYELAQLIVDERDNERRVVNDQFGAFDECESSTSRTAACLQGVAGDSAPQAPSSIFAAIQVLMSVGWSACGR
jgi:hypothetical protein